MKKLTVILLLALHLFNLAGYSLLFQCLINKSDTQLVKQLDNNKYNDKDLIAVKVPLNMPYINDSKDFERVNGQIEIAGIHYNYVKRKVSEDTLYVLCLPNISKTKLYNAKMDYAKATNDFPANKKSAESLKKSGFENEYNCILNPYFQSAFAVTSTNYFSFPFVRLQNIYLAIPKQPPKASC